MLEKQHLSGNTGFSTTEIMGGYFSEKTKGGKTYLVEVEKKKYHPLFKDLLVDSKGNIDMGQFTYEGIRKRFPKDQYRIVKENGGYKVYDKFNNSIVAEYSKSSNFRIDNKITNILFIKNKQYMVYNGFVNHYVELGPNWRKQTNYNDKGEIESSSYEKNGEFKYILEYLNGYAYKKIDSDRNVFNVLVNDLKEDIYAKNKYGLPTTRKSLYKNVTKRITPDNVYEVLNEYKRVTGNDLRDDIRVEIGLKRKTRASIIKHIENQMLNITKKQGDESGIYVANLLFDDIFGPGSGNLKNDIKFINKHNVRQVVREYYNLSNEYNFSAETLVSAIDNEWGLNQKTKNYCINLIKKAASEIKSYKEKINEVVTDNNESKVIYKALYVDDIANDVKKHSSTQDLSIDMKRLGHRNETHGNFDNNIKPNGKIDGEFAQGNIGNCWLIAGLISIYDKPVGREYLNSLLSYDKKNKCIIVNLKGVNKKYKIPVSMIEKSNHLARGDMDIRAFEIAIDKYIKDKAYASHTDSEGLSVDIEGNHTTVLYSLLYGDNKCKSISDNTIISNMDFNSNTMAYSLGTGDEKIKAEYMQENKKSINTDISSEHAYIVVKSDSEYIYLKDPNFNIESDLKTYLYNGTSLEEFTINLIRISRKELNNKNIALYKVELQ